MTPIRQRADARRAATRCTDYIRRQSKRLTKTNERCKTGNEIFMKIEPLGITDGRPGKFTTQGGFVVDAFRYCLEGEPSDLPLWFTSSSRWDLADGQLVVTCLFGKLKVIVGDGDWILKQPSGEFAVLEDRVFWQMFSRTCPRCEGDGKAHGADRPFESSGSGDYPGPCPVCKGSGVRP